MSRQRMSGFTLVELMITVAVLAILVAIGFPSFQGVLRSNRVATGTNELIASFALARSEAIRNTLGSGVCPSANGTSCTNDWNDGWLVWQDADGNGNLDGTEPVLRYSQAKDKLDLVSGGAVKFVFDSRGRATGRSSANAALAGAQTMTLEPDSCPSGQQLLRTITIAPTGQVRVAKGACQ